MKLQAITPSFFPWYDYSRYSFSLGLKTQTGAYLSGHTASEFDPLKNKIVVHGSMTEQVSKSYCKIEAILNAGGLGFQDVVRVVEYVQSDNIDRYAEAAAARAKVFGKYQPTIYTVPVKSLLRPDAFIEIEVTAGPVGAATLVDSLSSPIRDSAGLVYLPTVQAVNEHGEIVAAGDIISQLAYIFEKTEKILSKLGMDFKNVVKTVDYLTSSGISHYKGAEVIRQQYFGFVKPASAGFIMPRLLHPDALIQCDFIISRDEPVCINPGWPGYEKRSFSPAVRAGKMLFISGQTAIDEQSQIVINSQDVVAQSEIIYNKIASILHAAGGGTQNLVKTIEYVTPEGLRDYRNVAEVRSRLLSLPFPASTGLICEALLRSEMMIEVDPFAILD